MREWRWEMVELTDHQSQEVEGKPQLHSCLTLMAQVLVPCWNQMHVHRRLTVPRIHRVYTFVPDMSSSHQSGGMGITTTTTSLVSIFLSYKSGNERPEKLHFLPVAHVPAPVSRFPLLYLSPVGVWTARLIFEFWVALLKGFHPENRGKRLGYISSHIAVVSSELFFPGMTEQLKNIDLESTMS